MTLCGGMLSRRVQTLQTHSDRLSSGLAKLLDTQEKVSALEDDLREKTVVVEEKKAAAEEFAQRVGEEKAKVTAESDKANVEAQNCAEIKRSVEEQRVNAQLQHTQREAPGGEPLLLAQHVYRHSDRRLKAQPLWCVLNSGLLRVRLGKGHSFGAAGRGCAEHS